MRKMAKCALKGVGFQCQSSKEEGLRQTGGVGVHLYYTLPFLETSKRETVSI